MVLSLPIIKIKCFCLGSCQPSIQIQRGAPNLLGKLLKIETLPLPPICLSASSAWEVGVKSQGRSIKASGDSNKHLVKANWKYEISKDSRFPWNIHLLYQPNVCKSSVLPIPKRPPFLGMAKWHLSSQLWVHMLLQVLLEPALLDLRRIFRIGGFHVSHKKSPLTFHYLSLSLSLSSAVNPCPSPLSIRIYIYIMIYIHIVYTKILVV